MKMNGAQKILRAKRRTKRRAKHLENECSTFLLFSPKKDASKKVAHKKGKAKGLVMILLSMKEINHSSG